MAIKIQYDNIKDFNINDIFTININQEIENKYKLTKIEKHIIKTQSGEDGYSVAILEPI